MSFNPSKCCVLRIPGSKSQIISGYKLGDSELQETSSHSYLGVEIQQDLKWNSHIHNIIAQASKTLGFVRRNLGFCSRETKVAAYTALVRPTLEYCSAIWDIHKNSRRKLAKFKEEQHDWYITIMIDRLAHQDSYGIWNGTCCQLVAKYQD